MTKRITIGTRMTLRRNFIKPMLAKGMYDLNEGLKVALHLRRWTLGRSEPPPPYIPANLLGTFDEQHNGALSLKTSTGSALMFLKWLGEDDIDPPTIGVMFPVLPFWSHI